MSDQPETLEVRLDRVTPWWLFVFLAAMVVALGLLAWQVRGLGADVRAMHAQQPEAIAQATTPVEAAPTPAPAPARQRAPAPRRVSESETPTAAEPTPVPALPPITRQSLKQYRAELRAQE